MFSMANKRTLYKCYVGSKAHGLYMTESEYGEMATCDIDVMEFYAHDLDSYLSLDSYLTPDSKLTETIMEGEYDIVRHEIRKAINLLAKGNPNMLVTLFNTDDNILEMSEGGRMLRDNREMFLSKSSIVERFKGYSYDQLTRLERGVFRGYMGEKRKKIAEQFGYDTKNAMTLIRLLNEAIEVLKTGGITVNKQTQGTRDYYLAIKLGKWTLEQVKQEAERLAVEVDRAATKSEIPEKVDYNRINQLTIGILRADLRRRINNLF